MIVEVKLEKQVGFKSYVELLVLGCGLNFQRRAGVIGSEFLSNRLGKWNWEILNSELGVAVMRAP